MSTYLEIAQFEPFREEMVSFQKITTNLENIEMIK